MPPIQVLTDSPYAVTNKGSLSVSCPVATCPFPSRILRDVGFQALAGLAVGWILRITV